MQRFLFRGAFCHLLIRLMDSKSQLPLFLHYNQLISPLPFYSTSLSWFVSPLSDIPRCWKFKALMMGELSENADPPEQLVIARVKRKAFVCLCSLVRRALWKTPATSLPLVRGQASHVHERGKDVVYLILRGGAQSKQGWLLNCCGATVYWCTQVSLSSRLN